MKIKIYCISIIFVTSLNTVLCTRSFLHSSSAENDPVIITYNKPGDKDYYILRDSILEWYPTFGLYDLTHLMQNLLPKNTIQFRTDSSKSIEGKTLEKLLENFLQEIKAKKTVYKDFTVLKGKGFNTRKQAGLLVVKCKHYPFVVKLFMENPRSFIRPYNKGFEPACQFVIGGGITRHALGFTRIKNRTILENKISSTPELSNFVDIPRKWFWIPEQREYFYIRGYNFEESPITVQVPAVYAIIADEIEIERTLSIKRKKDRDIALKISEIFDYMIDPHINNFVIEKQTNKIVIIDTEHFPSLVGFKEKPTISSYFSYYFNLGIKYIKDRYGRLKNERANLRKEKIFPFHTLP